MPATKPIARELEETVFKGKKVEVAPLQGPGRNEPAAIARNHDEPRHRAA